MRAMKRGAEHVTLAAVRTCLSRVLPRLPDDPDTNLFQTGVIDSLSLMEATAAIEHIFGVVFEPDDLRAENFQTLRRLTHTIERLIKGVRDEQSS